MCGEKKPGSTATFRTLLNLEFNFSTVKMGSYWSLATPQCRHLGDILRYLLLSRLQKGLNGRP
jgi:hypothetical protein